MRYSVQGMHTLLLLAVSSFFVICFTAHSGSANDILIIVNPGVLTDDISQPVISDIYHGYKRRWDNGQKIRVVMFKEGATHEVFAESMVQLSPEKLKTLWKKYIFSGTGTPPKVLLSEKKCVEYIAATKGAIGYISSATSYDGVKVIEIR